MAGGRVGAGAEQHDRTRVGGNGAQTGLEVHELDGLGLVEAVAQLDDMAVAVAETRGKGCLGVLGIRTPGLEADVEEVGIERIAAHEHALLDYATPLLADIPGVRLVGTAAEKASVLSFVLAGHDTSRPHRRKERIPPGPAARAAADALRARQQPDPVSAVNDDVVIDLAKYDRAANGRNTLT